MGMANSPLFTPADEKIIYMNLDEVIELSVDFAALLTPACGGGADVGYDDAATFVGEAFIQMVTPQDAHTPLLFVSRHGQEWRTRHG
jgi:hypothetical protein